MSGPEADMWLFANCLVTSALNMHMRQVKWINAVRAGTQCELLTLCLPGLAYMHVECRYAADVAEQMLQYTVCCRQTVCL
jgi:hypothetical protein